jgi:hypothetical protein
MFQCMLFSTKKNYLQIENLKIKIQEFISSFKDEDYFINR